MVKTARVAQEKVEILIAELKELGNIIKEVTVDEQDFMYLFVFYISSSPSLA